MPTPFLERFRVILLDMNGTFMFGQDRLGPKEDFAEEKVSGTNGAFYGARAGLAGFHFARRVSFMSGLGSFLISGLRGCFMTGPFSLCMALFFAGQLAAPSQTPGEATQSAVQARRLALFQHEAADYRIFRDAEHAVELKLRDAPVFLWTNPTRYHGQEGATHGAVFVWTHRGCAEVIGTIFAHPEKGRLVVSHEFHSLSPVVLEPVRTRGSANRWSPRGHLPRRTVEGVDPPGASPSARLIQLRSIARRFTARSVTLRGERWDLRLLPQPPYRYQSDNPELIDGAVFIFASSAGTDPEVILVVEAAKMADEAQWQYGVARFSDANLFVEYDGKEVWTSVRGGENTHDHNPSYTFRYYRDKVVDALSDGEADETDGKQQSRQSERE